MPSTRPIALAFAFACSHAALAGPASVEVPVPVSASQIPSAIQQKYMAQAVDTAVGQLDFSLLDGRKLKLSVAGVLPMSESDLGAYIQQGVTAKLALAGGRVVPEANWQVLVQVRQAGLDKQQVVGTRTVRRSKAGPIAMGVATGLIGTVISASMEPVGIGVGAAIAGGGITGAVYWANGIARHPRTLTVSHTEWHARADIVATVVPESGAGWETQGTADVGIEDSAFLSR